MYSTQLNVSQMELESSQIERNSPYIDRFQSELSLAIKSETSTLTIIGKKYGQSMMNLYKPHQKLLSYHIIGNIRYLRVLNLAHIWGFPNFQLLLSRKLPLKETLKKHLPITLFFRAKNILFCYLFRKVA